MNRQLFYTLLFFTFLFSCQHESKTFVNKKTEAKPGKVQVIKLRNSLTQKEKTAGWELLFDGRSLDKWKGYNMEGDKIPSTWQAANDEILGRGKDNLITKEKYSDFDFILEFKLTEAANSGIFYFVQEIADQPIYQSAPEYQLVDNQTYLNTQGADFMHKHLTGDAFNLYDGIINPAIMKDKWYTARIKVEKGKVEHWLNGKLCIEYDFNSAEWKELIANSNFNKQYFAKNTTGHIGLQGWGNDIKFRNIKIKRL